MTRLLVSVRDAEEAEAALAGGADLVDVKEPRDGSLGRASAQALCEVADVVGKRAPLSAALGELNEPLDEATLRALEGYNYAKIGLAGALRCDGWQSAWSRAVHRFPAQVQPVAVIYADGEAHHAPPTDEILRLAIEFRCAAILIDTFKKNGRGLFDHWSPEETGRVVEFTRDQHLISVLAGALDAQSVHEATALKPDFVAVRSAVCREDRASPVCAELVSQLSSQLTRLRR